MPDTTFLQLLLGFIKETKQRKGFISTSRYLKYFPKSELNLAASLPISHFVNKLEWSTGTCHWKWPNKS